MDIWFVDINILNNFNKFMRSSILLFLIIQFSILALAVDDPDNGGILLKKNTAYTNTYFRFSFLLPAGWYIPKSTTDSDPHFYSCPKSFCKNSFEIVSNTIPLPIKELSPLSKGTFKVTKESFDIGVPDSDIYSWHESEPDGDGWDEGFIIVIKKLKKKFNIMTNNTKETSALLKEKRFKLL